MRVLILSSFLIQDDSVATDVGFVENKATFGSLETCLVELTLPKSSPESFKVSVVNLNPCIDLGKDKYKKSDLPPFWDDSEKGVIGREEDGKIICKRRIERVYSEFATFTGQIPEVGDFVRRPLIPSRVCRIMAHKFEEVKYLAIEKALKKTEEQRKADFLASFNECRKNEGSSAEPIDPELEGSSLESWAKFLSHKSPGVGHVDQTRYLNCIDSAVDSVIDGASAVIATTDSEAPDPTRTDSKEPHRARAGIVSTHGAAAVNVPNDMGTEYASFEEEMVFQLRGCLRDTSSVKDMMDMILERSITHGEKARDCLLSIQTLIRGQSLGVVKVFVRKIEANRVLNCFYGAFGEHKTYRDCILSDLYFPVAGRRTGNYHDPELEALYKCMTPLPKPVQEGININKQYSSCFGSAKWTWSRQRVIPEVEAVICVGKNFLLGLRSLSGVNTITDWKGMTTCHRSSS
jgi:hypothetical protein